ncbi:MAG: ATP-dependent helicase HrpB [Gemmatimonadaceae bacterium]|nr:ATP-dependent helicase HrpB [Gemmatimonadaceae bacterium]
MLPALPVTDAIPALLAALADRGTAVLVAPPGAGKTTLVPLALREAPWLGDARVLLLEPRRLAARAAAARMAQLLGEPVGRTVGWRMRGDTRVSAATRIEVVTEGVLTRLLLDDPLLGGIGAIVFDEFHERSLHGDTGLALALQSRTLVRDDLRLLVMSATIDGARVAALLDDAPVVESAGRSFPVTTSWRPPRAGHDVVQGVVGAVREAIADHAGDVLAFLPGAAEIRRAAELLDGTLGAAVDVHALHGLLDAAVQDAAIAPSPAGRRKVVLATSIAETSLTIEGVRVVVDGGQARVPRVSARTGMTRLETVRVTRAGADQRRGRAGRVAPGHCIRCWAEHEEPALRAHAAPEIADADLAPLALDLACAGIADPRTLRWLDTPPAAAFAQARALLHDLGALDGDGRVTAHGDAMARLGTHPRLAHMLLRAEALDATALACDVAAVLDERDPLRAPPGQPLDPDLALRVAALRDGRRALPAGLDADPGGLQRCREVARRFRDRLGVRRDADAPDADARLGALVALAYPERVARRRDGSGVRLLMRSGSGATIRDAGSALARAAWIACAALDDAGRDATVRTAAALDEATVRLLAGDAITRATTVAWDDDAGVVRAVDRETLGAIVLVERPARALPDGAVAAALRDAIVARGVAMLPWTDGARRLRERLAFVHAHDPAWPAVDDDTLRTTLDDWLVPHLGAARGLADLAALDLGALLLDRVGWERRALLDRLAPTHVTVPSGSRIPVDYADPAAPILAVRLQELFGATATPAVLDGTVPLVLHLLSPAHRPVQVTRDLAGFWRSSYADVRKDLRGRYPRHPWPEDPLTAPPTHRAKPRGT